MLKVKRNTIRDKLKKLEIGIELRPDMLEKQAKSVILGIGSNLGNRRHNIEKAKYLSLIHI